MGETTTDKNRENREEEVNEMRDRTDYKSDRENLRI